MPTKDSQRNAKGFHMTAAMREMSLGDVGQELGVTRERVRQIENIALRKCQAWLRKHHPELRMEDVLTSFEVKQSHYDQMEG